MSKNKKHDIKNKLFNLLQLPDNIFSEISPIDFLSNQKFFTYEFVNGKRAKKFIDKIRVRVEIEK